MQYVVVAMIALVCGVGAALHNNQARHVLYPGQEIATDQPLSACFDERVAIAIADRAKDSDAAAQELSDHFTEEKRCGTINSYRGHVGRRVYAGARDVVEFTDERGGILYVITNTPWKAHNET